MRFGGRASAVCGVLDDVLISKSTFIDLITDLRTRDSLSAANLHSDATNRSHTRSAMRFWMARTCYFNLLRHTLPF